jgi:CDP-paratose 2-epimerase
VIEQIGQLTGKKPQYSFAGWREGDQKYYVSDVSKAKKILDWEPRIAFDEGLRGLIDWAQTV